MEKLKDFKIHMRFKDKKKSKIKFSEYKMFIKVFSTRQQYTKQWQAVIFCAKSVALKNSMKVKRFIAYFMLKVINKVM